VKGELYPDCFEWDAMFTIDYELNLMVPLHAAPSLRADPETC
jgi:hypothetical protein